MARDVYASRAPNEWRLRVVGCSSLFSRCHTHGSSRARIIDHPWLRTGVVIVAVIGTYIKNNIFS